MRPKSSPNDSGRVHAIIFITLFFVCRAIPVSTKQYDTYVITRALGGSCIICPLSSIMEFTNKRPNGEKASIRMVGVLWNRLSV